VSIFKAYDIRGKVPGELDAEMATAIGRALIDIYKPEMVVVGRDCRLSNQLLFEALSAGIISMGADVIDLGYVTTPALYFAAGRGSFPMGVMITASHNPGEYNGFKIVKAGSFPLQEDELQEIKKRAEAGVASPPGPSGTMGRMDILRDYRDHVHRFSEGLSPLKVVMDAGNAVPGSLIPHVFKGLPLTILDLFFEPDGTFPNHQADPIKAENREAAREKLLQEGADLACVFDGDGDRVIFLDEKGEVVPGDMTTLIIALDHVAAGDKGPFLTDCRSSWIVEETLEAKGAGVIKSRVGHSFIKKTMRAEGASFGGELSGHYYFKANYFTENSDLAVLRIMRMMARQKVALSELTAPYRVYFNSGEINSTVEDKEGVMADLEEKYAAQGGRVSHIDGVTVEFDDWWFNVRPSNTEPLLRLNVEGRTEAAMAGNRDALLKVIRS
jgi:phosphomannomutase